MSTRHPNPTWRRRWMSTPGVLCFANESRIRPPTAFFFLAQASPTSTGTPAPKAGQHHPWFPNLANWTTKTLKIFITPAPKAQEDESGSRYLVCPARLVSAYDDPFPTSHLLVPVEQEHEQDSI